MKSLVFISTAGLCAFIFTLILVPVIKEFAIKINLIDKPNHRKLHTVPVPLIGGICIAISISFTALINPYIMEAVTQQKMLYGSSAVLLSMGVLDDRFDLSAKLKLCIQLCCSLGIAFSDVRIMSLYGLFGVYEIPIYLQYVLTVIIVTGIVNAVNLMDGVDGLIGEFTVLGFLMLFVFSLHLKMYSLAAISIAISFANVAFLKFNLNKHEIFMGDAGSLLLGNLLIGSTIYVLNTANSTPSVQPYILYAFSGFFAIPVLDSLRVYLGRIKYGKSPFKADKTHLHHLLLLFNLSHKHISMVVSLITVVFLISGIILVNYLQISFWLAFIIIVFSSLSLLLNLNKKLLMWQNRLKQLETL